MAKLIIRRKGYTRKAFTASRAGKKVAVASAKVKPSVFRVADRGKPGRGPKVVPPLKKGALGGPGFFNRKQEEQKGIVSRRAKRLGEKRVVGELRALQVFFKTTSPAKSRRAYQLSRWVAGSFKGKNKVTYPKGLSRKR